MMSDRDGQGRWAWTDGSEAEETSNDYHGILSTGNGMC